MAHANTGPSRGPRGPNLRVQGGGEKQQSPTSSASSRPHPASPPQTLSPPASPLLHGGGGHHRTRRSSPAASGTTPSNMDSGSDSDSAPEELTAVQGVEKHDEISKVEKDSAIRVSQQEKERRRRWAQRRTSSKPDKKEPLEVEDKDIKQKAENEEDEESEETHTMPGMLPTNVIEMLAAREKQTFSSDSEEEITNQKVQKRKKRLKSSGPETILLKDVRSTQHVKNALAFLEQRKNQVPRSNAVLKNANKALRLLSSKGNFLS
ncbi:uncharacterized protein LOC127761729 [Oryza glaberrima]|uniref:Uncharacterized protein n=2 Tax=Oryza TaxID=4527 RepID=A0A0D3F1Q2_9ORYZ|nr:uncharacterized protein LOC127761729 [Oryza glaberrima]